MSSIYKRKHKHGTTYRCQVRRKGFKTILKTFHTRTEEKKWARTIERELDQGNCFDYSESNRLTLRDLFKCYIRENKHKKNKS